MRISNKIDVESLVHFSNALRHNIHFQILDVVVRTEVCNYSFEGSLLCH